MLWKNILSVLLEMDRKSKMQDMKEEKSCPRCGSKEKVKNGYNRGKQRYLCKECGRNYTGTKNGYQKSTKPEGLK